MRSTSIRLPSSLPGLSTAAACGPRQSATTTASFTYYFGDPDNGIYMVKAKNPAGPWDPPVLVKKAKGWIDTCPFWDDDGQAYLVHAFAGSARA